VDGFFPLTSGSIEKAKFLFTKGRAGESPDADDDIFFDNGVGDDGQVKYFFTNFTKVVKILEMSCAKVIETASGAEDLGSSTARVKGFRNLSFATQLFVTSVTYIVHCF
jgi:hypothetical protein